MKARKKQVRITKIKVGDIYEDCNYHPCLCTISKGDYLEGISLIDGSSPRSCSIIHCAPRKITLKEALEIKLNGPSEEKKKHWAALEESGWKFSDKWWK